MLKKQTAKKNNYFDEARAWGVERYQRQTVHLHRWQWAFWLTLGLACLLGLSLLCLLPLKSWEPLVIEHNVETGEIFTHPLAVDNLPKVDSEIQSDVVRYVTARETYAAFDQGARYRLVQFMSTPTVFKPFEAEHSFSNDESPEVLLGKTGQRVVTIEDVVFLDASDPRLYEAKRESQKAKRTPPIAKIDFMTTETNGSVEKKQYWVATLSFEYLGTPDTKEAAWANWDGFTVTAYRVDQRNI